MKNTSENSPGAVEASEQTTMQPNIPSNLPSSNAASLSPSTVEPAVVEISPAQVTPSAVQPSCGCNENANDQQLVYAIGTIGTDFGTDAILDSFKFFMRGIRDEEGKTIEYPDPHNPHHLLSYFEGEDSYSGHAYDAVRVIWTVSQNGTPIYAIRPEGSFSEMAYARLIEFLRPVDDKDDDGDITRIDLCSFPGHISGSVKLRSGQVVPVITPNIRAMYNWRTIDLVTLVYDKIKKESKKPKEFGEHHQHMVDRLANKLGFQLQNFGISSADRAVNHTATNLYNVGHEIANKLKEGYELDVIRVEKSNICRPDSDCQDVLITFFNPEKRLDSAKHVYRFTVDVSKVIPVSIGATRDWYEY